MFLKVNGVLAVVYSADGSLRMRFKDRPLDMTKGSLLVNCEHKLSFANFLPGFKRLKSLRQCAYFSLEKFGH